VCSTGRLSVRGESPRGRLALELLPVRPGWPPPSRAILACSNNARDRNQDADDVQKVPQPFSEAARNRMVANRGRDTRPERALRSSLHRLGLRFRLQGAVVPGTRRRVDIVFGPARVAVLVDGCFWHGCPDHGTSAKANAEFWDAKITANVRRDLDTNDRLRRAGWTVVRVWEHEDPSSAAVEIERLVHEKRTIGADA